MRFRQIVRTVTAAGFAHAAANPPAPAAPAVAKAVPKNGDLSDLILVTLPGAGVFRVT
jgi:hypothetical protein